jgi:hypothetical protein
MDVGGGKHQLVCLSGEKGKLRVSEPDMIFKNTFANTSEYASAQPFLQICAAWPSYAYNEECKSMQEDRNAKESRFNPEGLELPFSGQLAHLSIK